MSGLLLDTNVLIWYFSKDTTLNASVLGVIENSTVFISAASVWEISIKRVLGKLKTPDDLLEMLASKGFIELPVTFIHAKRTETLPEIHKDPFDRLLVAQALCEHLMIVTRDAHILAYPVKTIAA